MFAGYARPFLAICSSQYADTVGNTTADQDLTCATYSSGPEQCLKCSSFDPTKLKMSLITSSIENQKP